MARLGYSLTLRALHKNLNTITDDMEISIMNNILAGMLEDALKNSEKNVELSSQGFVDADIPQIIDFLSTAPDSMMPMSLFVNNNRFTDKGARELLEAIKGKNITAVDIADNPEVSPGVQFQINLAIKRNVRDHSPALTTLGNTRPSDSVGAWTGREQEAPAVPGQSAGVGSR